MKGGDRSTAVVEVVAFFEALAVENWDGTRNANAVTSEGILTVLSSMRNTADAVDALLQYEETPDRPDLCSSSYDRDDDDDLSIELIRLKDSEEEIREELEIVDKAATIYDNMSDLSGDQDDAKSLTSVQDLSMFFTNLLVDDPSCSSSTHMMPDSDSAPSPRGPKNERSNYLPYGYETSYFVRAMRKRGGNLTLNLEGRLPKIIIPGRRMKVSRKRDPSPFFEISLQEVHVGIFPSSHTQSKICAW